MPNHPESKRVFAIGEKVVAAIDNMLHEGVVVGYEGDFYIVKLDREYLERYYYRLTPSEVTPWIADS